MQAAATQALNDELADSLSEFSSFERMSADVNDLIYAIWKALHAGGEYAKVRAAARHRLQPATRHPTPCARIE
eukprot:928695-Prymnesium_polylepis.1